MAVMQRWRIDLVAVAIAAAVTMPLIPDGGAARITEAMAAIEAADYLDDVPQYAALEGERWRVSDGDDTAWLDARTGALVEIEFAPSTAR